MVEMQETATILHAATDRSLVILDEIGRGTATFDGMSLAWAVAEHLASNTPRADRRRCSPRTTTSSRTWPTRVPGVVNLHVAAREFKDDIVFLHKIVPGRSDRSYGIQVARLAGLPPAVVARAMEILKALEHDELQRGGRPSLSGAPPAEQRQLGLFQPAAGPPARRPPARNRRRPPDAARRAHAAGRTQTRGRRMTLAGVRRAVVCRPPGLAFAVRLPVRIRCRLAPTTIVIALANSPTNLDPAVGLDEASQKMHQLLYRSLLKTDATLRVVPDLAVRFETTDSTNYVAEIPHGVTFHDGREMTADDVAYTFRRFLDPAFVSGRKGAYSSLASVDVVDRYTVVFRLKAPSASFPINLIMGIVPAGTGAAAARQPIGSGPYRLAEFVPDDHVDARARSPTPYGGAPANGGLIFKVVPDETMRGLELRNRSVDLVVNDLSPDLVHGLAASRRPRRSTTAPGTDYAYIGFNLRDPRCGDPRVRWAIAYAVDTTAIVDVPASRPGAARPPASCRRCRGPTRTTSNSSRTIRPRRGGSWTRPGFRDPDGHGPAPRLRLTLKTSTDERYRLQAAVIQQNLADVGIAIDVRSYEFATLMADVIRGNVQLYTLQYVGVTDPDMLRRAFHSIADAAGGLQPRALRQSRRWTRCIDRRARRSTRRRGARSTLRCSNSSPPTRRTSACGPRPTSPSRRATSRASRSRPPRTSRFCRQRASDAVGGRRRVGGRIF